MITIKGKYNEATAYVDIIEEQCLSQLYNICKGYRQHFGNFVR